MTVTAVEKLSAFRQAAADARSHAEDLRERIRSGDGTVTGRHLAEADASIEVADLRVQAAEAEAAAEQDAERVRQLHAAADRYLADEPAARARFAEAVSAARTALRAVITAAGAHQAVTEAARAAAETYSNGDHGDRLVRTPGRYGAISVDGRRIDDVTAAEWIAHLTAEALKACPTRDEGRQLHPKEETR